MILKCPLCDWYAAPTLKSVVRHIGAYHAHEANFSVCHRSRNRGGQGGLCPPNNLGGRAWPTQYNNHRHIMVVAMNNDNQLCQGICGGK